MRSSKQQQKSGDNSTNIQADSIKFEYTGVTVSEVREIALDVFKANAYELSKEAAQIAQQRVQWFVDEILRKLLEKNPAGLESFKDPDMQYVLIDAQKAYARSGNEDLAELLVNMLVERASEQERTLKQVVLDEALSVIPKLTTTQIDMLTIIFLLKGTYLKVPRDTSLKELLNLYQAEIVPLYLRMKGDKAGALHLLYAGCCVRGTQEAIVTILMKHYPDLFYKGFTQEEFELIWNDIKPNKLPDKPIIVPDPNDSDLWRVVFDADMANVISDFGTNNEKLRKFHKFVSGFRMTEEEVSAYIGEFSSIEMLSFIEMWYTSGMTGLELTSVGLAIALANFSKEQNEDFELTDFLW